MRGRLFLFEGLDRTGKSTQAQLLADELQGRLYMFPDRSTPIGEAINRFLTDLSFDLSDESVHLLFSANRWERASEIERLLSGGTHVVMDRYVYSGIAYSLAKDNACDATWLCSPRVGMEELRTRDGWGSERYEKEQFQIRVKECFFRVLRADTDTSIEIVDVNGLGISEAQDALWAIVERRAMYDLTEDPLKRFEQLF
ncbi:P-loop containing nucleoside triphosphate hydrolase protein [Metschnikowia bicuspidata]|uniref:dTMP kinase n=1 Tax=Metschnikowia bicuspidata TaxID=27322 RepID=A0A4P9ZAV1_9ASCO|nr:P-loop containing nucleoside triphosphate hydrolase protein [Metschnikowia bicuspidata]